MSILNALPHTCTAKRRKRTIDSFGGTKDTFPTTLFTDRACWRQAASHKEILEFEKRDISVTHKVYFVTDPEVNERDVLVIDGDTLEVRSYSDPDATVGKGIAYKVMTELKRTG